MALSAQSPSSSAVLVEGARLIIGDASVPIEDGANPLENIRDTREIASVYLRRVMLDRDALVAKWSKIGAN